MDSIDRALLQAWNALAPTVRANRAEAVRRAMRRTRAAYLRPIRPWCLCLRASDTRFDYPFATAMQEGAIENQEPHTLLVTGYNLQDLCQPVSIPWPGIDWTHAAARLGRHPETIRGWMDKGVFNISRRYARAAGKRGHPVPFIWSRHSLDPSANLGAPPDSVWGSLWQSLSDQIPITDVYLLKRIPRSREYPCRSDFGPRHRGWNWICPGINGHACGRRVSRIFIPLRPWDLLDALDEPDPLDVTFRFPSDADAHNVRFIPRLSTNTHAPTPAGEPGADTFRPAPLHPPKPDDEDAPTRILQPACHHCHRIRYFSLTDRNGWNTFVTHISRGLLFGHEVKRPDDLVRKRKRVYTPHARAAPRRDQARGLLLAGLPPAQVAKIMNVKVGTVYSYTKALRRRGELTPTTRSAQATASR